MLERLAANAVVVAALAGAWAWLHLRVRVLRDSGAVPYARRLAQRNVALFGGMALAFTVLVWVPGTGGAWVYGTGATLAIVASLVVTVRGARGAAGTGQT